jgi:hypothetical protein
LKTHSAKKTFSTNRLRGIGRKQIGIFHVKLIIGKKTLPAVRQVKKITLFAAMGVLQTVYSGK